VSTADNGTSYEDNGIGLYWWKTTAAADIDDDAIGGVGVYTVMVCRWTDHILARNPLLEVEADLS